LVRAKEFDRDAVLDKALELFWFKGYEQTSIQDLVQAMGINRGSMYDTFKDKQSIYQEAFERYTMRRGTAMVTLLRNAPSLKEGVNMLLQQIVEDAVQTTQPKGCFITNTCVELAPHDDAMREKLAQIFGSMEHALDEAICSAIQRGEIRSDKNARQLARFLVSSINGLQVMAKANNDRELLEDIVLQTLSVLD